MHAKRFWIEQGLIQTSQGATDILQKTVINIKATFILEHWSASSAVHKLVTARDAQASLDSVTDHLNDKTLDYVITYVL